MKANFNKSVELAIKARVSPDESASGVRGGRSGRHIHTTGAAHSQAAQVQAAQVQAAQVQAAQVQAQDVQDRVIATYNHGKGKYIQLTHLP